MSKKENVPALQTNDKAPEKPESVSAEQIDPHVLEVEVANLRSENDQLKRRVLQQQALINKQNVAILNLAVNLKS